MFPSDLTDITDLFDISSLLPGLRFAGFMAVLLVIAGLVVIAAFYALTAFKWQFIGRKAGLQKDWMPFVPFARAVYKLSIVDEAWWKMFFLDGWYLYAFLLDTILGLFSSKPGWTTFVSVIVVLYLIACLAYNIYWRFKFYTAHNVRPHLALSLLVPGLNMIRTVWDYMIAFGRNYPFTGEGTSRAMMDVVNVPQMRDASGNPIAVTRALKVSESGAPWQGGAQPAGAAAPSSAGAGGSVTGLSGMYAGQDLPLAASEEMIVGRDNVFCNLIIDSNADKVSRKHCGILFDPIRSVYMVTDYSTNGTFVDGGSRLVANMPTALQRGTVIALGNRENRFKLN